MNFAIHYMRPEWFRNGISYQKPDPRNLDATHIHLMDIEVDGTEPLEKAYHRMQGEVWSPNGEARDLISSKGLQHTSMSVGDVIVNKDSGEVYVVAQFGFDWLNSQDWTPAPRGHRTNEPSQEN